MAWAGNPLRTASSASGTGDGALVAPIAGLRLHGWSIREDAGTPAAAEVEIHNGVDATGAVLGAITLAASGSQTVFSVQGIACPGGIYLSRVTGTTVVVVYYTVEP